MDSAGHNRIHDVFHVFWEALVQQHHLERMEDNKPRTWEDARRPLPADWHTGATVSLATWLNMWGGLCHNASGLGDFPNWIRTNGPTRFNSQQFKVCLNKSQFKQLLKGTIRQILER